MMNKSRSGSLFIIIFIYLFFDKRVPHTIAMLSTIVRVVASFPEVLFSELL